MYNKCELLIPTEQIDGYYCAVNGLKAIRGCSEEGSVDCGGYASCIEKFKDGTLVPHKRVKK